MRLVSPADFAAELSGTEGVLGVCYPTTAPGLLADLSAIVGSPKHYGLFERATLLVTPANVCAPRDELGGRLVDGYLLPFMSDDAGEWPDIYGFDMADPKLERVVVYSVHTIVEQWPNAEAFITWVRNFVPPTQRSQ
jgi:hypothetical protein